MFKKWRRPVLSVLVVATTFNTLAFLIWHTVKIETIISALIGGSIGVALGLWDERRNLAAADNRIAWHRENERVTQSVFLNHINVATPSLQTSSGQSISMQTGSSTDLLRTVLTPKQYTALCAGRPVELRSETGGQWVLDYNILFEKMSPGEYQQWCVLPVTNVYGFWGEGSGNELDTLDCIVASVLLLQTNETKFRAIGNPLRLQHLPKWG